MGSATAAGACFQQPFQLRSPNGCTECEQHVPVSLPLLVASSVFLAELLSVGRAEDRPSMGLHKQGMFIPLNTYIYIYIFISKSIYIYIYPGVFSPAYV